MISVLYVDDDPSLLEIGKLFLEMIGKFSVETCTSAKEGLQKLEKVSYHAVLSDYDMPEMNGIQFLKEVRSRYPSLPFVIFTGRGREDVVIDALNNGVDFYLQKGGEPKSQFAELAHKLHVAVQRRRSDEKIKHLARLYSILSLTNEATTYIRDRTALLSEVCQIAVREGGFLMVWTGDINPESGSIDVTAHCSSAGNPSYPPVEPGEVLPLDAPPTAIAAKEGRYYIIEDNREDSLIAQWKDNMLSHGFNSCGAFPLRAGEQVIGTMTFHASEIRFFSEDEVLLLLELTDNISISLELMEREQDITELRQMRDALRSANKKLNLLNNIIRHDILNTVTGLIGLEDMVLDIVKDNGAVDLLHEIKYSTLKIRQQIAFTREYQDIGVNEPTWQYVDEVIARATVQLNNRNITITKDLHDLEIYADPLLEKVFYNLVDNAVRHGETISLINFYTRQQPDAIVLVCEDDGIGIPDSEKNLIFNPGYGKNTGQGLYLIREILAITGINIIENGVYDKGARFEMTIPNNANKGYRL
ncbi:MAG: response regulator [Methanoregulaceae archaeon]|nr:response regulator [Methanoregulaceae archaeon]MDD5049100.1 response regulator [Methanoregulaceae archaeon]